MQATQDSAAAEIPVALAQFDQLPNSARVRVPVVAALYGVSKETIWRWARIGLLPAPSKDGPNTTTWAVGDLRHHRATKS